MVFTKVEDALSNCEVSAFGGRHAAEEIKAQRPWPKPKDSSGLSSIKFFSNN
jgi:hypothetical protein